MTIFTLADYNAVRAAIDTSLDEDMLPDSVVALTIYAGAATTWAQERDTSYASRTGTELVKLRRATILYCAGLLAPAVPQMVDAKDERLSRRLAERNMEAHGRALIARADEIISGLTSATTRPTFFARASGTRGK